MNGVFEYIDERIQTFLETEIRPGFYVGTVSNALQSLRRVAVDAEWGPTLEQARRISSPLLDVIPAVDTRMAILSQDGVPEFPAVIGKIWDDAAPVDTMTAWLRANLQEHPGHVELGAEDGVRIKVGPNSTEITETDAGEIVIEAVPESGTGAVRIENANHELLERVSAALGEVSSALGNLNTDTTMTMLGPQPLSKAASYGTLQSQINSIQSDIDNLRG